jgi:hypothetical protein
VTGFVAAVKIGARWVRLCHGTSTCTGILPPGRGVKAVGAVNIDTTNRRSSATFALSRG